ncbi:phosphohistidine phosphatase [Erythrobacter sp. JL475]|nr:phosphohistidine phosphatase [Erythrobacter sp. JL475]
MKILGLFRHAKSEWDDTAKRDFDRGLNERGRRGAVTMGDHIRAHGIEWDRLIASPAVRVTETLQLGIPEIPAFLDEKLYLASSDTIMEVAVAHAGEGADEAEAILMSGHNPGLQETILELVSPAHENDLFREACVKFPTASYAVLECNVDRWADLRPRCAKLVHFARPRDIDPELGPEY